MRTVVLDEAKSLKLVYSRRNRTEGVVRGAVALPGRVLGLTP
jgi:hypothetical protein